LENEWKRLFSSVSEVAAFQGQKKAKFSEVEEKLRDYINDKRQFSCAV
jgi:hypothetical protein